MTAPARANLRTVAQTAEYLGVSQGRVYRQIVAGELPSIRLGRLFVPDLEEWIRAPWKPIPPRRPVVPPPPPLPVGPSLEALLPPPAERVFARPHRPRRAG